MASRILLIVLIYILGSCKQVRMISDVFVKPTPREIYARNFKEDNPKYIQWSRAFKLALRDSLYIDLPFYEIGEFVPENFPVHGYNIGLKQGEKIVVSVTILNSKPAFIDLYRYKKSDSLQPIPILSKKQHGRFTVEFPVQESGTYKVLIQPELYETADFQIDIYSRPTFAFPVAGVSDEAIQSFWGAPRSNGKRTHEGVDIFAPKSTPVLAATEGRIRYTGERGLGGKQVWLQEGIFKKSLYYAHLDSINVSVAEKIFVGDTLGFVGNTGNAQTTAPHLHFGIYTRGAAINPLPFIRRSQRRKVALERPATKGLIAATKANIRLGASVKAPKIHILEKYDTIRILGKTVNWYHIKLSDGTHGFTYQSLVDEIK